MITAHSLQDLAKLIGPEDVEIAEEPESMQPSDKKAIRSEYRNSTYGIVSRVAYLIGVNREIFGDGLQFSGEIYTELDKLQEARIIRNLCRIRNAMEQNYIAISNAFHQTYNNIGSLPEYIPTDAVNQLNKDEVRIYKTNPEVDDYIIAINTEINNRIQTVAKVFPEWVKWEYIRLVFLMPNGTKKDGVKKAGEYYISDRNRYPYQCWVNWDAVASGTGNILYEDEKFLTILYESNNDYFSSLSMVRDAGNQTFRNLENLLEKSRKCVVVVDCENADAVKLAAAMSSLPIAQLDKVEKVLLFDSEYTTDQWKTYVDQSLKDAAKDKTSLNLKHIVVERLNQNKSQVDMTLAVRTCREVYTAGVDAVILVSSDSDYWAMIRQLPGVNFLVMLEKRKTGQVIMDTLALHNIPYCFTDDFCTGASYSIKTTTLINAIQEQIDRVMSGEFENKFNVRNMMETALQDSWISMTEREKEAFYSRYLMHMKMTISQDGRIEIKIQG